MGTDHSVPASHHSRRIEPTAVHRAIFQHPLHRQHDPTQHRPTLQILKRLSHLLQRPRLNLAPYRKLLDQREQLPQVFPRPHRRRNDPRLPDTIDTAETLNGSFAIPTTATVPPRRKHRKAVS